MSFDRIQTASVIRFPYFGAREADAGETEGRKDRPVAVRDLPPKELKKIPTVCGSLRRALGCLEFLTAGGVFDDDFIDSTIELKMIEVIRFEHTPAPGRARDVLFGVTRTRSSQGRGDAVDLRRAPARVGVRCRACGRRRLSAAMLQTRCPCGHEHIPLLRRWTAKPYGLLAGETGCPADHQPLKMCSR